MTWLHPPIAPVVPGLSSRGVARRVACGTALLCAMAFAQEACSAQRCDTRSYPLSAADARFEPLDDGTIVDRQSRLMWMRCSAGQRWTGHDCVGNARAVKYGAAQALADDINRDGALFFSDWRLPRVAELASLAERECANPRINLTAFPETPAAFYWTSTTRPHAPEGFVFALSFGDEGVRFLDKEEALHLRLVRDAR